MMLRDSLEDVVWVLEVTVGVLATVILGFLVGAFIFAALRLLFQLFV